MVYLLFLVMFNFVPDPANCRTVVVLSLQLSWFTNPTFTQPTSGLATQITRTHVWNWFVQNIVAIIIHSDFYNILKTELINKTELRTVLEAHFYLSENLELLFSTSKLEIYFHWKKHLLRHHFSFINYANTT